MSIFNELLLRSSGRRFIKRRIVELLPELAFIDFEDHNLRMYLSLKDMKGPSYHLLHRPRRFMDYEEHNRSRMMEILRSAEGNPGVLDIGANIGLFSVLAATQCPQARVIAFDPDPVCYLALTKTKLFNRINNLDILPLGLGDKTKLNSFYFDPLNHGGHSFDESNINSGGKPIRSSLLSFCLDDLLPALDIANVHVIKVDVQGFEWEVLRGAERTLAKHRPNLLVECEHKYAVRAGPVISKLFPGYRCQPADSQDIFPISDLPEVISRRLDGGSAFSDYWFLP